MLGVIASLSVTLISQYRADHLHGWPDAWEFVQSLILSGLIGVALYALVAIIRAPFIVIGRQHRQLLDVNNRLAEVESLPVASSTPLLSAVSAVAHDSAEPNIVMRLDGGLVNAWGSDLIYEGDYSSSYKTVVIRCKNERECSPSRKVGGVGNVSAEISFTGYGEKYFHIPGDLGAWLRERVERVNFPLGVTHKLVVAKLEDDKLYAVQRQSYESKTTVWFGELDGTSDHFRVKVALYADAERKPLTSSDYILERDGRLFGRNETFAGPQLIPTRIWRSSRALCFWNELHAFWKLDSEGVSLKEFEIDYKAREAEASKFIKQHYGEAEKRAFLFEPEPEPINSSPNPFRRPKREPPASFRERLDAQQKQLDRLEKAGGL